MKKINFKVILIAAAVIACFALSGCEKDGDNTSGKLKIQLTDAPFPADLVAEANVTINKIDIRKAEDEEEENPFITLKEEEMSFNLLELTNGVTAGLVDMEIEAGSYDHVRLYVSDASVVLTDGTEFDLFVPSGAQSGVKIFIEPSIRVAGGLTAELLLDFDVSKSFVVQGNMDTPAGIKGFSFKPVVKASNLTTAGRLTGFVTDTNDVAVDGAQVAIIAADTVYTTSFTDEVGAYTVIGIDAGTYNVEYAKEGYETATVEELEIIEGNVTTQDIELAPATQ
jgi:hypothetical protein